jgi:hypothetical protein
MKRDNPFEEDTPEQNLLKLVTHTIEEERGSVHTSKCPSPNELRFLHSGASHAPSQPDSLQVRSA